MTLSFALSWCTVQIGCVCFSSLYMYSHMSWLIAPLISNTCFVWIQSICAPQCDTWCWLSSCLGEQPSLWGLDTQEPLSMAEKTNTPDFWKNWFFWFLDIMLKDRWDSNAHLVGVSSYRFRIMGVASVTSAPRFSYRPVSICIGLPLVKQPTRNSTCTITTFYDNSTLIFHKKVVYYLNITS